MKSALLNSLILVGVAVLLIWQFSSRNDLNARLAAMESANQQQTAVLHRALGKVIPIELSASLEGELAALETQIKDKNQWPKDVSGVERIQKELDGLIDQIPVWAEEDLLPRLNLVRWGISSLRFIAIANDETLSDQTDVADALDTALDATPANAPGVLIEELTTKRNAVEKKQTDLAKSRLTAERKQFLESASNRLNKALAEEDASIRQVLLGRILEDVVTERLSLVDDPESDPAIGNQLTALMGKLRMEAEQDATVREQKWHDYQKWALGQVKSFNAVYDANKGGKLIKGNAGKIRDAMVSYLLPVSTNSLDSAVSRLYDDAFSNGWSKLEDVVDTKGVDLQFYIASQEAVVKKRMP